MSEQYRSFNQALMGQLNPSLDTGFQNSAIPTVNMQDDGQFPETSPNTGAGDLIVQVTLARGSIPVEGATVTVTDGSNPSNRIAVLHTDNSGRTERLSLPAPSASLSQTPVGVTRPYSIYNILVEQPGYYTVRLNAVPIFDRVSSIQPVALIPVAEGDVERAELNIDESHAETL